jgi:hypothetical protein
MRAKLVKESIKIEESIKHLKPFTRKQIIQNLKKFKKRKMRR